MKALPPTNQMLKPRLVLEMRVKLQGQRSEGKGHGIKFFVRRNAHVKYESPPTTNQKL
jgi:hypothetical protein